MSNRETDGNSDVLCACGCGLHLRRKQVKLGIRFRNRTHANRWNCQNVLKGKKYKKRIFEKEYEMRINGRMYCSNYSREETKCVRCVELAVFKVKPCYKEPIRNEMRHL